MGGVRSGRGRERGREGEKEREGKGEKVKVRSGQRERGRKDREEGKREGCQEESMKGEGSGEVDQARGVRYSLRQLHTFPLTPLPVFSPPAALWPSWHCLHSV